MASDHSPRPGAPRYSPAQRRLLAVSAGLGVAVLAGAAFVITYDDLRVLAIEGRAAKRWAPAYPVMADALITVTILSLVVARHARWWSRLTRWTLLLALFAGAGAASVQRAMDGYGPLPNQPLKAGVAVAPYVMLALAVWLWLAMFKQAARARLPEPEPYGPAEDVVPGLVDDDARRDTGPVRPPELKFPPVPAAQVFYPEPVAAEEPADVPAPTSATDPDPEPEDAPSPATVTAEDVPFPPVDAVGPGPVDQAPPVAWLDEPEPAPAVPEPRPPASLPTDVELVRRRPASKPSETTQPDMKMPAIAPETVDQDEPPVDRAEDPDAGDDETPPAAPPRLPNGNPVDTDPDPDEWRPTAPQDVEWTPPSSKFRSSPTPPRD